MTHLRLLDNVRAAWAEGVHLNTAWIALLVGGLFALGIPGRRAAAASCRDDVGAAKADIYVRECLAITTATHPPCNAANSCQTIGEHIQTMCGQDADAPGWCTAYRTATVPNPPPAMPAPKPGFDCAKATSPVEREICAGGHDSVANDDRKMSQLYARLLATTKDAGAVRAGQREFVQERQHCAAPELGRSNEGLALVHCIAALTRERIDELKELSGGGKDNPWTASGPPDPCEVSFGDDGWDQLNVLVKAGQVEFDWSDLRDIVLRPSDTVGFDVDGTVYPGRVDTNKDGQTVGLSADPKLIAALDRGRMIRVKRNGKVILRAPLAGYAATDAQARKLCGLAGQ